jgi:hypothetical protein
MQAAPGVAVLLAVLEQEMHSLLRQKLALQTELHLAGALAGLSNSSSNGRQLQQLQPGPAAEMRASQEDDEDLLLQQLRQLVARNHQLEAALAQLQQERDMLQQQVQANSDAAGDAVHPAAVAADSADPAAADASAGSSKPMLQLIQQQQLMLKQLLLACEQQQEQGIFIGGWQLLQTAAQQVGPV